MNDNALQQVLDRIAIEDCLHRYCHAVDRCDADLLRTVYWPDGSDDHVFWSGNAMDFVDFCIPILKSRDQTLHAISNVCTLTFAAVYHPAVTGVILAIVATGLTIERSRTRPRVQSADRQTRG